MVTASQIAALKWLVWKSQDGTDLAKRALLFLIDQSDGLKVEICFSLQADREGFTGADIRETAFSVDSILSGNCATHLNEILEAVGSEMSVSVHYGDYDPTRPDDPLNCDGQFAGTGFRRVVRPELVREGMPMRYTFWLSQKQYSREAYLALVTRELLEQIQLKEPELYRDRQLL